MTRVLYWPQLSMRSYRDNTWLVDQDSQVTKMKAWMNALPDDWEWTWVLPHLDDRSIWSPDCSWISCNWAPNVQLDRHLVDVDLWHVAEVEDFDVAFVEAIEHVAPLREILKFVGKEMAIIGMIGLYDDRNDGFYLRQLEGFLASSHVIFPVEAVRRAWMARVKIMVEPKQLGHEISKVPHSVVPAIFSPRETLMAKPQHVVGGSVPSIFYTGRLSDPERTKWPVLVKALKKLDPDSYRLWVANPNDAFTVKEIYKQLYPIDPEIVGMVRGRDSYLRLLWEADIVPMLYDMESGYSVGVLEAITAKCHIVNPHAYDVDTVAEALELAIKGTNREQLMREQMDWAMSRSVEANVDKIKSIVEEVTAWRGKA